MRGVKSGWGEIGRGEETRRERTEEERDGMWRESVVDLELTR